MGDACEDYDGDNKLNACDNCPTTTNTSQRDSNDNQLGDACDGSSSEGCFFQESAVAGAASPTSALFGASLVVFGVMVGAAWSVGADVSSRHLLGRRDTAAPKREVPAGPPFFYGKGRPRSPAPWAGAPSAGLGTGGEPSMTTKVRKLTATVSAAALLGAGGVGAAQAASATSDRPAGPRGGHHALSTTQLQTIASKLGVTTAQLQTAIDANQPARPDGRRGEDMTATLAAVSRGDGEVQTTSTPTGRPSGRHGRRAARSPASPTAASSSRRSPPASTSTRPR